MKIEYTLSFRRTPPPPLSEPRLEPQHRPPRLARMMALAHRLDGLVRSDQVPSYAELARLGNVTPARLTQILTLLHLAPAIQEYLLLLAPADARFLCELRLRKIARQPLWDRQRKMFARLLRAR